MSAVVDGLKWRHACKAFDSSKIVSDEKITSLIESINLAPTSYGLQPFQIVLVKNQELKVKLVDVSFGQNQVKDCSHLLVFAIQKSFGAEHIDAYINRIVEIRKVDKTTVSAYGDFMKNTITSKTDAEIEIWQSKQVYIALGTLMAACGELQIDSCPMEGFEPSKYDEILDLSSKNLSSVLVCPVGYRSTEDFSAELKKVRKTTQELLIEI